MNNLTKEEIVYLYALVEISKMGLISNNYTFYDDYAEGSICLNKNNNIWQVYLCERENKYEFSIFNDLKDACMKTIWYCSYDKIEMETAIECFLMEVTKGYLLSDEEISEFKNKYLNDLCNYSKKKIKENKY